MTRTKKAILSALVAATAVAGNAQAATISWGAAQDTTSVSDISTDGTLVAAFNGGENSVTAGGITWAAANPFGFASAGGFQATGTGDAGFDSLLTSASFSFNGNNTGNSGTIDLGVFTPGVPYQVQVFFADQRVAQNDRTNRIGSIDADGAGPTVDLESDPNNDVSAPFGQFAIGAFVADGFDPDLTVLGTDFASAQINAWQIRNVIPEPTSLSVAAVAILGLARRRVGR